jgi:hypothetical protein
MSMPVRIVEDKDEGSWIIYLRKFYDLELREALFMSSAC